jgi:DUF971 family protein
MPAFPTTIKLAGAENAVTIEWSDGHRSTYPYSYLRSKCPCATCAENGPPSDPGTSPFPILGRRPLKPERAELVGRYALQIYWSDGHSTGIYTFDFLRDLCPCPECAAQRTAENNAAEIL